jgi:hypothetical protein
MSNMRNGFWLLTAVLFVALAGCGNKQNEVPTGPAKESVSAPAPTPIDRSTLGEVTGKISFEGAKPRPQRINMDQDPACMENRHSPVFAEDGAVNANGTLPNVFVYVKAGAEKYAFAPSANVAVLDQNGCMYKPHVLGLMAGQILKIVSSDDTTHNIHPMPQNNREWNMSQTPGAAPIEQKFARPEVMIPVKCNQHPWMRAWIGVASNPFYSLTGSDGRFTLKGLPAGEYTIGAWTATFGTQEQKVTLGAKEAKSVDFKFMAP